MIKKSFFWIVVSVFLLTPIEGGAKKIGSFLIGPISATFIRVVDGDTILVQAHPWIKQDIEVFVRLRGIDAPEPRGKCNLEKEMAQQSKKYLSDMLENSLTQGKMIFLENITIDKYGGRVVADVILAPLASNLSHYFSSHRMDMGKMMVQNGFAKLYDGKQRRSWCPDKDTE